MGKFKKFALNLRDMKAIKGGGACENCVASAFIACDASCGGGACDRSVCVQSQTGHCMSQSYCQQ